MNMTVNHDAVNAELIQSMSSVLGNMQDSMSGEVASIRNQTEQIESLLKDAIASLHEAFEEIHAVSDQQMQAMTAMMMGVVGEGDGKNIFQKAENASVILTSLVDALLLSSKNNLSALTTMDALQKDLMKARVMEKEKEALIAQLCTCGETEKKNGETIHRLIQQLSDDGDHADLIAQLRICGEAEKVNGERVHGLTQELLSKQNEQAKYTTKMMLQFKKTHCLIDAVASKDMDEVFAAKERVEQILNHFFQINEMVTESRVQVNKLNADMRKHLGSAIRALQFEDISTQSLAHTDRHLDRMQGMLTILSEGLPKLTNNDSDMHEYVQQLSAIHIAMLAYHQQLQLEDSNPVSQESMDEGDIDLF